MRVNQSEFARMAGVSKVAISKAVKSGKIRVTSKGKINTSSKEAIAYLESKKQTADKSTENITTKTKDRKNTNKNTGKKTEVITIDKPRKGLMPPWKPGQSGNLNGAPRGPRMTTILREALSADPETLEQRFGLPVIEGGMTVQDRIIRKMILMALKGNEKMMIYIMDRIDGKPVAPVITPGDVQRPQYDLNKYTVEELQKLIQLGT